MDQVLLMNIGMSKTLGGKREGPFEILRPSPESLREEATNSRTPDPRKRNGRPSWLKRPFAKLGQRK